MEVLLSYCRHVAFLSTPKVNMQRHNDYEWEPPVLLMVQPDLFYDPQQQQHYYVQQENQEQQYEGENYEGQYGFEQNQEFGFEQNQEFGFEQNQEFYFGENEDYDNNYGRYL
uniref:Uncharacterized protein n=1 Tax=Panagrolaimus superbus TaxID=310955 RepID=A0A914YKK9_9BILA